MTSKFDTAVTRKYYAAKRIDYYSQDGRGDSVLEAHTAVRVKRQKELLIVSKPKRCRYAVDSPVYRSEKPINI